MARSLDAMIVRATAWVVFGLGVQLGCGGRGQSDQGESCAKIQRVLGADTREQFVRAGASAANTEDLMRRFESRFGELCAAASEAERTCLARGLVSRSEKACDPVWTRLLMAVSGP